MPEAALLPSSVFQVCVCGGGGGGWGRGETTSLKNIRETHTHTLCHTRHSNSFYLAYDPQVLPSHMHLVRQLQPQYNSVSFSSDQPGGGVPDSFHKRHKGVLLLGVSVRNPIVPRVCFGRLVGFLNLVGI